MGSDELELTNLAAGKQPPDFLDVLSDMLLEPRQDLRVAGARECRDLCQDRLAKSAACALHAGFERRSGVRNDAGPGEQGRNLPEGTTSWKHVMQRL